MTDPNGVVIHAWSCPVSWHRYVKWDDAEAYCQEQGCEHSNVEPLLDRPLIHRVSTMPRSAVTIHLPDEE